MKEYTLREIQTLTIEQKDELMSTTCKLGYKTAGSKPRFVAQTVSMPIAEYNKLKGENNE